MCCWDKALQVVHPSEGSSDELVVACSMSIWKKKLQCVNDARERLCDRIRFYVVCHVDNIET